MFLPPVRSLAQRIWRAQGVTMSQTEGDTASIRGDFKGNINDLKFAKGATRDEKALQLMTASYASLFSTDAEAYDAARNAACDAGEDSPQGLGERMAAGFLAHSGKSFKQTLRAKQRFQSSLFKHATAGAESYVSGEKGNAYTEYLVSKLGAMDPARQAVAIHVMTDRSSPESGWNEEYIRTGEALSGAGLQDVGTSRAAASHPGPLVLRRDQARKAIIGLEAFGSALVDARVGPEHPNMTPAEKIVRNAVVGHTIPKISNSLFNATRAIMEVAETEEEGRAACGNIALVQTVAQLSSSGGANGGLSEAMNSYRSLEVVMNRQLRSVAPGPLSVETASVHRTAPGPQPNDQTNVIYRETGNRSDSTSAPRTESINVPMHEQSQFEPSRVFLDPPAHWNNNDLNQAMNFIVDMENAGFSASQIQDPQIAYIGMHTEPSRLSTAAVAANIMGQDFNAGSIDVVEQMIDAGWSARQIARPDVYTAQAIIQHNSHNPGGHPPTPEYVRKVRIDPLFVPRMNQTQPLPSGIFTPPVFRQPGRSDGSGRGPA